MTLPPIRFTKKCRSLRIRNVRNGSSKPPPCDGGKDRMKHTGTYLIFHYFHHENKKMCKANFLRWDLLYKYVTKSRLCYVPSVAVDILHRACYN